MSTIKVEDIAHVRFAAPDLEAMKAFLGEFGLIEEPSSHGVLYMRGTGPQPFLHATSLGQPAFQALGLRAESVNDLQTLAASEGVSVEESSAPGGGLVVGLRDPNGFRVEVVAGQNPAADLALSKEHARNDARAKTRLRAPTRLAEGPAHVVRLGHAVLEVKDFRASESWYKSRFGFVTSDEIELAPGMAIGAFLLSNRVQLRPPFRVQFRPPPGERLAVHRGTRARSGAPWRSAAKRAGVAVDCRVGTIFRRDF
jgi:catechol 2,3-dioxygenase-like lactoylglutathione lyase family enzyme